MLQPPDAQSKASTPIRHCVGPKTFTILKPAGNGGGISRARASDSFNYSWRVVRIALECPFATSARPIIISGKSPWATVVEGKKA
jgi:hypothetical protein